MDNQVASKILDGLLVQKNCLNDIKNEVKILTSRFNRPPGLATILVGDDPASQVYVGKKLKTCEEVGIQSFHYPIADSVDQDELQDVIHSLNANDEVDGILLQVPLPKGFDEQKMLNLISPSKDVDGFHPENVGRLLLGMPCFRPCTPSGIVYLLDYYGVKTEGKHVVIVGRSNIVGKPLAALLVQKSPFGNATVTVCHSRTKDLESYTKQADILIAAIGRPEFISSDMVKEGAVVIDVGMNRVKDSKFSRGYKLVGDVAFSSVSGKASYITPVPGGVGPLTIAMLMKNTLLSYKLTQGLEVSL